MLIADLVIMVGIYTGKSYTICVFPLTWFTFCDIIDLRYYVEFCEVVE
jgi:hypothetical protein